MKLFKRKRELILEHCGCEVNNCDCGYQYKVTLNEEPKNVGFNRKFPYFKDLLKK